MSTFSKESVTIPRPKSLKQAFMFLKEARTALADNTSPQKVEELEYRVKQHELYFKGYLMEKFFHLDRVDSESKLVWVEQPEGSEYALVAVEEQDEKPFVINLNDDDLNLPLPEQLDTEEALRLYKPLTKIQNRFFDPNATKIQF